MSTSPQLRPSIPADLEYFFQFQLNVQGQYLAAFMPKDPADKQAYMKKYRRLLEIPQINMQTILWDGQVVGSISKFETEGAAEITYWLDKPCWGKGIGSAALRQFLQLEKMRPLQARIAFDNIGSQRMLEKNGFIQTGTDTGFANARQTEIVELIYTLS